MMRERRRFHPTAPRGGGARARRRTAGRPGGGGWPWRTHAAAPTWVMHAAAAMWAMRAAAMALVLVVLAPGPVRAQDGGTESVLSIGGASRSFGVGGASVAGATDASALLWNPAMLRSVERAELAVMVMPLFGDFSGADYTFAAFALPTLDAGTFGASFQRVGSTFDRFDAFSRPLGEGAYSETQFAVGWAFTLHSHWIAGEAAIGASVKASRIVVDPFSSTAPGVDVGVRWTPSFWRDLALGAAVRDLVGAQHKLDVDTDPTYRTILAGATWRRRTAGGAQLAVSAQVDLPEQAASRVHAGIEYAFSRLVALRAGWDDGEFAFGLGVRASRYAFDYAMVSRDAAGTSHPVTFTIGFGRTLAERRLAIARAREREMELAIRRTFEARVRGHRQRARRAEAAGEWQEALDEWKIVLEYVPDDSTAMAAAAGARERVLEAQARAVEDVEKQAIVRTRFAQGLDFFNQKDWLRARAEWQAILAVDSTHAGARQYLERTQGRIDAAVQDHMARARRFERQGRLTEAIAEWNNVQQYDPGNALARRAVDRIRRRIESASRDLESAQRRLRVVTLYDEALAAYNRGDYRGALQRLDELLRAEPGHEDALRLRNMAHRRLTPLTPDEKREIRRLYLRGMQYFSRDEYEKAVAEWEKILRIDPTNESVQKNIREARERLERLRRQP